MTPIPESTFKKQVPPDMTACTRVEVVFVPSTLDCVCREESVLTAKEKAYIQSLKTIVSQDRQVIKRLADAVNKAAYDKSLEGVSPGQNSVKNSAAFRCYQNKSLVADFVWQGSHIYLNGRWFRITGFFEPLDVLPPELQAFRLRDNCVLTMAKLRGEFDLYFRRNRRYPPSESWCDSLVEGRTALGGSYDKSLEALTRYTKCPSAGEGRCHYAVNSNYEPNSPDGTVFLFETKAGWNQRGGPELFTLDNHHPKGGCVFVQGEGVKFIRTREELAQLRWKP